MTNGSDEFYAGTVEGAVAKASATLGIPKERLEIDVLDEGSSGFLGIGARDARVRVLNGPNAAGDNAEPQTTEPQEAESETDSGPPVETITAEPEESSDETSRSEAGFVDAPPASPEILENAKGLVSSALEAMGFEARVDVYDADDIVAVDIASDNTALLIGQKGETIDALQFLVNAAVYRNREFVKRIVLDSEGYRQRRVEAIQGMAHRSARRAIRERRKVEMPPMNSSERRIVHMYLHENPRVSTVSEGTGDGRKVTIIPE